MLEFANHGHHVRRLQTECLNQIKVEPCLKAEILRLLAANVEIRILSDANTFFIDTILKSNGLQAIGTVVSNPAAFDEHGRLLIQPFHTDPHPADSTSPPNLCKGLCTVDHERKQLGMCVQDAQCDRARA